MAQTYTLDEAADKLDLSVEEFKRRLRTEWSGKVHQFRDGSTLRFRTSDIDELARTLGLGSSEELPLADQAEPEMPDEIGLATDAPPAKKPRTDVDAPLKLDDSDEVFHLSSDSGKGSSGKKVRPKSDSDVKLERADARSAGGADDEESILTEEYQVPSAGGSGKLSGKSGKLSAARLKGDSGKKVGDSSGKGKAAASQPPEEDSSEFELSLDADSDEFELSLAQDSSEEVSLGELPPGKAKSGSSGINLNRPADSGLSLEKRKPKSEDEEVDFELSLDAPGSGKSSSKFGSGKLGKGTQADSDSEFELTLEEPSDLAAEAAGDKKGDIFEATDFEIPALEDDSASEVVSLEESDTDLEASSDFDLALDEADASAEDESASEVVALDDAGRRKAKARRKAVDDDDDGAVDLGDDLEEGPSASKALRGVRRDEDDEDYEVSEAVEDEETRTVVAAGPANWGALPAVLMIPTVLLMFFGGLMAYELLHSAWGYQQGSQPTTPLVSFIADTVGMKPAQ
jgi:hypothetical protein